MHGRRSRGDGVTSHPEFGVGDANANCPPQILSYRYKKEGSMALKDAKISFRPGSASDPVDGGAHAAPPDSLVGWGGSTLHHTPSHSVRAHLRRSPCVPQNSSQIYACACAHGVGFLHWLHIGTSQYCHLAAVCRVKHHGRRRRPSGLRQWLWSPRPSRRSTSGSPVTYE